MFDTQFFPCHFFLLGGTISVTKQAKPFWIYSSRFIEFPVSKAPYTTPTQSTGQAVFLVASIIHQNLKDNKMDFYWTVLWNREGIDAALYKAAQESEFCLKAEVHWMVTVKIKTRQLFL